MICLKISTFVVSKTTAFFNVSVEIELWFAWKSVPLWYLKQRNLTSQYFIIVVICLKISTFVVSKTTLCFSRICAIRLWFAWKSVPLWYLKQHRRVPELSKSVVICLRISTFVVSKTTHLLILRLKELLWFAWKSVPLWYLKQLGNLAI